MKDLNVCLINDSFPPYIDGVATVVQNYGHIINNELGRASVVTPYNPNGDDSGFDFPVIRFPSIDTTQLTGYRAGIPFSAETIKTLEECNFDIIHSHCPVASSMLGRVLRNQINKPLVFTYHTKFDIDIQNIIKSKLVQEEATRLLVDNVSASDEVWAVSDGAGKNLQSLGYEGDYIVMHNGVDFPKGRVDKQLVEDVTGIYDLPKDIPVFLFVGRMMWYKGIRIILDAMNKLKHHNFDFRMIFVGGGSDKNEITEYAKSLNLDDKVIFCEPIADRLALRAWYTRANLFLFPSSFDTNGLVVREAAACALASVLIKGSCAAEDTNDMENAFHIAENADSMCSLLLKIGKDFDLMRKVGENAQNELYLSWEDSVKAAYERYQIVIDRYNCGEIKRKEGLSDQFFKASSDAVGSILQIQNIKDQIYNDAIREVREIRASIEGIDELRVRSFEKARFIRQNIRHELREKYENAIDRIFKELDRYK